MSFPATVNRRRATLADLGRLFLFEVARANIGFARRCASAAEELSDRDRRSAVGRALGGAARDLGAIEAILRSDAEQAYQLRIREVEVTFWAEPVRRGIFAWFRRVVRRRRQPLSQDLYRLVAAKDNARAAQFRMTIGPGPLGDITATLPALYRPLSPTDWTSLALARPAAEGPTS